ncbi:MAG: hypothetical protein ABJB98_07765 [Actinomycetota bacterium]
MNRWAKWAVVAAVATGFGLLAVPAAAGGASDCAVWWGSLDKTSAGGGTGGPLVNVRAGQHPCYDRLVMENAAIAHVRYVPAVLTQGRGDALSLRGGAFLEIVLRTTDYDINTGAPTYSPSNRNELVKVSGWRTFRQVAEGRSFEGYTTIGLGVRARLPFRVFTLPGPGSKSRLVIDVAHRWITPPDLPAPTSTAIQASALGDDRNADLVGIRTGAHQGYDRVVFDFRGPETGLRYVALYRGDTLEVDLEHGTVRNAIYHGPSILHPALAQLKEVRIARVDPDGTIVQLILGHKAGFRVFRLFAPDRIVVDIAH